MQNAKCKVQNGAAGAGEGHKANGNLKFDISDLKGDNALKAPELAGKLQISVRKVRDLVAEKKIPVMRIGRLVRFDYDEVRKALTEFAAKNAESTETKGIPGVGSMGNMGGMADGKSQMAKAGGK